VSQRFHRGAFVGDGTRGKISESVSLIERLSVQGTAFYLPVQCFRARGTKAAERFEMTCLAK